MPTTVPDIFLGVEKMLIKLIAISDRKEKGMVTYLLFLSSL